MSIKDIGFGGEMTQKVASDPLQFSVSQLTSMKGDVPDYILLPAIQYVVEQQKRMQMAQTLQQPLVEEQPSVVEQVMQEAAQMGGGVEQLPTNLPQEYAGGGIVAFKYGGETEEDELKRRVKQYQAPDVQAEMDRGDLAAAVKKALIGAGKLSQGIGALKQDISSMPLRAQTAMGEMLGRPLRALGMDVPHAPEDLRDFKAFPAFSAFNRQDVQQPPPTETVRSLAEAQQQSGREALEAARAGVAGVTGTTLPGADSAATMIPSIGIPKGKAPEAPKAPKAIDYTGLLENLPKEKQAEAQKAIDILTTAFKENVEPVYGKEEERIAKRKASLADRSEIDKGVLALEMAQKIANARSGSTFRDFFGSIPTETIMKQVASKRAAEDKIEDMQSNLAFAKANAKMGNLEAAQKAGREAASDYQSAKNLQIQAAHFGDQAANQRYATEMSGYNAERQIQAHLATSSAQLALGYKRLEMLQKQIDSGDKRAQAMMLSSVQKANADFNNSPEKRAIEMKYKGDFSSPNAQRELQDARKTFILNSMALSMAGGAGAGGSNIPNADDLI